MQIKITNIILQLPLIRKDLVLAGLLTDKKI